MGFDLMSRVCPGSWPGDRRAQAPSVGKGPGAMAVKRMPLGPHSTASDWVMTLRPAFDIAEGTVKGPPLQIQVVRIETTDGVHGIGDGTLNGRELAVASYLEDHLLPLIMGRDPEDIEDIWQMLYNGAYWRRGPVTMAAIAAIDVALWDIKGKVLGSPLWNLLGGRSRTGVLVYSHASGRRVEEAVDKVLELQAQGYKAVRVQCVVPGIEEM